jgi:16S rRNA (guanine966-N2)-methyltransferase
MRVIAGTARSLRLTAPKGLAIRPTSDAMRETLFNVIGGVVTEGAFLDVYAGSGSVGIEALSRGAPRCAFIERDRRCVQAIVRNLENTALSSRAAVVRGDARRVVVRAAREHGPFRIAFVDPPYGDPGAADVVLSLLAPGALEAEGVLILQRSRRDDAPGLPEPTSTRPFGETELLFFSVPSEER